MTPSFLGERGWPAITMRSVVQFAAPRTPQVLEFCAGVGGLTEPLVRAVAQSEGTLYLNELNSDFRHILHSRFPTATLLADDYRLVCTRTPPSYYSRAPLPPFALRSQLAHKCAPVHLWFHWQRPPLLCVRILAAITCISPTQRR